MRSGKVAYSLNNRVKEQYEEWIRYTHHSSGIREDLERIEDDEAALTERFYRDLEFGTGGMRGILGAGTNRMNIYTVRRATLGLARYLKAKRVEMDNGEEVYTYPSRPVMSNSKSLKVVIGYDCRRMSFEFALEAGQVLAAEGISAAVFEHLCPTPELSFAVRELQADAGIMITASHNPPEYNGYKVYGSDGGQLLPAAADAVVEQISSVTDLFSIPLLPKVQAEGLGLLTWLGSDMDKSYYRRVLRETAFPGVKPAERAALTLVYSPLHGTGNWPVREVLQAAGYDNLVVVSSQADPDGEFPTVKSPNPEEPAAFALALETARAAGAEIALATDPDADRVGVAVRNELGDYTLLTGNQTGGLLLDFLLAQRKQAGTLASNAIVFKTIVTSDLGAAVAKEYGVDVEDTLTGFKYIGERISYYEGTGEKQFLFGYEESYGYLLASMVRDKDAVQSCLAIAEMAAHHKAAGKDLLQALEELYKRVGYFQEELMSATMPGASGLKTIENLMQRLRAGGLAGFGGVNGSGGVSGWDGLDANLDVAFIEDYEPGTRTWRATGAKQPLTLPQANVLKYGFVDGSWLAVRPSGTEPKIKFYLGAKGKDRNHCQQQLTILRAAVESILDSAKHQPGV